MIKTNSKHNPMIGKLTQYLKAFCFQAELFFGSTRPVISHSSNDPLKKTTSQILITIHNMIFWSQTEIIQNRRSKLIAKH